MSMKVNIDSITLDILSARLKNLVSPMDILKWLNNFEEEEQHLAVNFLKNYTIYTSYEIEDALNHGLEKILNSTPNSEKIVIHPVGSFGKSGSLVAYLLNKTNTYSKNQNRFNLCSSIEELEKIRSTQFKLILIDDFVGTGGSIIKYWDKKLTPINHRVKELIFLGVAGMENGVESIKPIFNEVFILKSNIFKKAFSSDASYFGYRNHLDYRELCYKYGSLLTRKEILKNKSVRYPDSLGYSNSQAMVGFYYGSPNNSLPVFWHPGTDDTPWFPLFPRFSNEKISVSRNFRKRLSFELSLFREFDSQALTQQFRTLKIKRGSKMFSTISHVDFSLYGILKLKRKGHSVFMICQILGISEIDYLEYIKKGIKNGIFTSESQISVYGLELYKEADSIIKNHKKSIFEDVDLKEKKILYVPKKFNGRS
ncbi:hypothetical protein D3C71_349050 [compost metagenome]